ncbi:MAG: hypothetical protein HQ517_06195, partial [SAR324 cluster bacterium]|nr:hypothetical protein [SAR324 cluster bacterium]
MLKILFLIAALGTIFLLGAGSDLQRTATMQEKGTTFGRLPKPTERGIVDTALDIIFGRERRKTVIKRIPKINGTMRMPHAYWGECSRCHLFTDKVVISKKTPYGRFMASVST